MKKILLPLFVCLVFSGCEKDNYKKIDMVEIEETIIPDTVINYEHVQIKIKASAADLCWSDLFVELKEIELFKYSIKSYGTFTCREGGCVCAGMMLFKDTIINFQPTQKGTYLFNISETRNRIVVDTMIVK